MITVTPTDQYLWPTLRDSPCRLIFQYRSLLRQERLLISSLFTCVMLQVIEFSTTQTLSVLPEFRGIEKFLRLVCMKTFNYRSISSDWTKMKPDLAASCPWCFIIYPHNWISHQASHLIGSFWLMIVLWASFIRHSSHRGWKFQQKTCHSLALAILCWFEGQTNPLKMIKPKKIK